MKKYSFALIRCSSLSYREYNIISNDSNYLGYIEQKMPAGRYDVTSSLLDLYIKSYNLSYIKNKIEKEYQKLLKLKGENNG